MVAMNLFPVLLVSLSAVLASDLLVVLQAQEPGPASLTLPAQWEYSAPLLSPSTATWSRAEPRKIPLWSSMMADGTFS
ncbi:MAG: hypothetical protein R3F31_10550 [Verrucomicrobiales bacterium]